MPQLNGTDRLTAIEAAKRNGVTEDQRRIIETMSVTNQLLLDIPVFEANEGTAHTHLKRTALPSAQRRMYNKGVKNSASQTTPVRDILTQIASLCEVDAKLVREQRDPQGFLMGEAQAHIEAMGIMQAEDFIYGNNNAEPSQIDGFASRRRKLEENLCVDMGGTESGSLTSIFLVKAGRGKLAYIYPKGAKGIGVERIDYGKKLIDDEDGGKYEAYQNYFTCDYGLTVGDDRSLIRLANIDPSNLDGDKIVRELLSLDRKLAPGDGNVVAYMNADVLNAIDLSIAQKGNVNYTAEDPWGRPVVMLRHIRLRQVDSILNEEEKVVA